MALKIISLSLEQYGSKPSGSFSLVGDGNHIRIEMTEDEARELSLLAVKFFFDRQAEIAKSIADIKPLVLTSPDIEEASFTEIPSHCEEFPV